MRKQEVLIKVDFYLKDDNYKSTPKYKIDVILMPQRELLKTHYRKMDKKAIRVGSLIADEYVKKGYEIYDVQV